MKHCYYCNEALGEPYVTQFNSLSLNCCDVECSKKIIAFLSRVKRAKVCFSVLSTIAGALMLAPLVFIVRMDMGSGIILLVLGIFLMGLNSCAFPFATGQSIEALGIRGSQRIVRTIGVIFLLVSTPILVFTLI